MKNGSSALICMILSCASFQARAGLWDGFISGDDSASESTSGFSHIYRTIWTRNVSQTHGCLKSLIQPASRLKNCRQWRPSEHSGLLVDGNNGLILVSSQDVMLLAVSMGDLSEHFSFQMGARLSMVPVSTGRGYLLGDQKGGLYHIDGRGRSLWSMHLDDAIESATAITTETGNAVVVQVQSDDLYLVDMADASIKWHIPGESHALMKRIGGFTPVWVSSIKPGEDSLLYGLSDGTLRLVSVESGAVEGERTFGSSQAPLNNFVSAPAVFGRNILAAHGNTSIWRVSRNELAPFDAFGGEGWLQAVRFEDDLIALGGGMLKRMTISGERQWQVKSRRLDSAHGIILHNGRVWVLTHQNGIQVFNGQTGAFVQRLPYQVSSTKMVSVFSDMVALQTVNGTLVVLTSSPVASPDSSARAARLRK